MPEFRDLQYARFCAKERARTDLVMNCMTAVTALVLMRLASGNGHGFVAAWLLGVALRHVAVVGLLYWRFSLFSRWREGLFAALRLLTIVDVIVIRAAVESPGRAHCSKLHLILAVLNYGGILGLSIPALAFQLHFRAHCITQTLALVAVVATNSLACQLVFTVADMLPASGTAAMDHVSGRGCPSDAVQHQFWVMPCEAMLFYLQVVLGFAIPTLVAWCRSAHLTETFMRIDAPPARPESLHPHNGISGERRGIMRLSQGQQLGIAALVLLVTLRVLWELVSRYHEQMHLQQIGESWKLLASAVAYAKSHPADVVSMLPVLAVIAVRVVPALR